MVIVRPPSSPKPDRVHPRSAVWPSSRAPSPNPSLIDLHSAPSPTPSQITPHGATLLGRDWTAVTSTTSCCSRRSALLPCAQRSASKGASPGKRTASKGSSTDQRSASRSTSKKTSTSEFIPLAPLKKLRPSILQLLRDMGVDPQSTEKDDDNDGALDWGDWLDTRIAPGGPLALVDSFRRAATLGHVDELREAKTRIEEMGLDFVHSLDTTCCAFGDADVKLETRPLWAWGNSRLEDFTAAEKMLHTAIVTAKRGLVEALGIDRAETDADFPTIQKPGQRRSTLEQGPRGRTITLAFAYNNIAAGAAAYAENHDQYVLDMFARKQAKLAVAEEMLRASLREVQSCYGLSGGGTWNVAQETLDKIVQASLKDFHTFMKERDYVIRNLDEAVDNTRFGCTNEWLALNIKVLKDGLMTVLREPGVEALVGLDVAQIAQGAGIELPLGGIGLNPFASVKIEVPPWRAICLKAFERLVQLRRMINGELADSPLDQLAL